MRTEAYHQVLDERRRIAARAFERGMDANDIAALLEIHPQTVRAWRRVYEAGGWQALRAKPHLGPRCKLGEQQKQQYLQWLQHPPSHYGYGRQLWTTKLMARLIFDRFGVEYSHNHIGVIMHELGYSWQLPAKQARERDQAQIDRWRQESWPAIVQQSRQRTSALVFVDEAGFSMIPTLAKQWAVKGRTPVVKHRNRWFRKVSVIGALRISADREQVDLTVQFHPDAHIDQPRVAAFLELLVTQHEGALDVIWDNLSSHGGSVIRTFLEKHPHVHLHRLPPYAPDLNPIEGVWSLTKYHRMANHQITDLPTLHERAEAEIADVAAQPHLLHACIRHTGLADALWLSRDQ
jgi:transposase